MKPGELSAMISSTVWDLPEHREQVRDACLCEHVFPIGMEQRPAQDADGVRVSLEMVDQSDVYVGIYAWRYGWVPDFDNPDKISITEMEFNRALQRKESGDLKEVLIFIMDNAHPIVASDKEDGDQAQEKLRKFKLRASDKRNVRKFKSKEELKTQIIHALAHLKEGRAANAGIAAPAPAKASNPMPKPPAFYAAPNYIGSHQFVGRGAELRALGDWALPADPTNLLLFEAIGGNGKSMLTWEWTTKHAPNVRIGKDAWAGRYWYSFYEHGAIMADFCQRALAYMTGRPLEGFAKKKTAELKDELLAQLHARPWLLILDGLERVLVAYHRIDAAEVPDEEANAPTDKIANRNPCDAIRDEDNDLLRALAAAAPSKILVSSRLTPRVLLNPSGQPITGAKRITLPGLRPPDAEELLASCGVKGDSAAIQRYLTTNCDNHPLVIGILGGLIANYLPDRGNFDAWVADPQAGAALDLASLDLIQWRNHILRAALDALPPASNALLCTLALLTESVDYETLNAFNPHLPPEPEEVEKPEPVEKRRDFVDGHYVTWDNASAGQKAEWLKQYEADLAKWQDYKKAVQARLASAKFRTGPKKLEATVKDLEQRGLLQWDGRERKYDLHPVVRGVASGGMAAADRERHGQRVVDHFSSLPHNRYEQAQKVEDLRPGLNVVRTLSKLGHHAQAVDAYRGLVTPLFYSLEAHYEILSLLRPFFADGWSHLPAKIGPLDAGGLANHAATSLQNLHEYSEALDAYNLSLRTALQYGESLPNCLEDMFLIADTLLAANKLGKQEHCLGLATEFAMRSQIDSNIFLSRLRNFDSLSRRGFFGPAHDLWKLLDPRGRDWNRHFYRYGDAEYAFAQSQFWQGRLLNRHLTEAASEGEKDNNRPCLRSIHRLRGDWRLEQGDWAQAAASYQEALRLARERSLTDAASETGLALAKHHLRRSADPQHPDERAESRHEAERLAQLRNPAHRRLAQLWLALGDAGQAKHHALAAYRWAWADGEPYVHRYELTKTTELLQQMQIPIPNLPPYDPFKDEPFPWEADVRAAIEKLRAAKEAE